MKIGAILPTSNLWGGVKRFLEIGNRLVAQGHNFTLFTPQGNKPSWMSFAGMSETFTNINTASYDALFITEPEFLPQLNDAKAKVKIFYHVLKSESLKPILQYPHIKIFVNSTNLYLYDQKRYRITPFKAIGGVTIPPSKAKVKRKEGDCFTILTYGRLTTPRKGTRFVIKACERLYKKYKNIRLVLFDTPLDTRAQNLIDTFTCKIPFSFIVNHPVNKNYQLFQQADIFSLAEKNAGWSNTCAEAMAAGIPVVATRSGTMDFLKNRETGLVVKRNSFSIERALKQLLNNQELKNTYAQNGQLAMVNFTWDRLTEKIIRYLAQT